MLRLQLRSVTRRVLLPRLLSLRVRQLWAPGLYLPATTLASRVRLVALATRQRRVRWRAQPAHCLLERAVRPKKEVVQHQRRGEATPPPSCQASPSRPSARLVPPRRPRPLRHRRRPSTERHPSRWAQSPPCPRADFKVPSAAAPRSHLLLVSHLVPYRRRMRPVCIRVVLL